jgi:hypothetical protein
MKALPDSGAFEVQLEGGEPTVHPAFWSFIEATRGLSQCTRLVLCTNGVALPRNTPQLQNYLDRRGSPLTVKLSVNHHLLDQDHGLLQLAGRIRTEFQTSGRDQDLILNVRLRRGVVQDDQGVVDAVRDAGLLDLANVFHLQRYGMASGEAGWDLPNLVGTNFRLVNPDGTVLGTDLIARSEAMKGLA